MMRTHARGAVALAIACALAACGRGTQPASSQQAQGGYVAATDRDVPKTKDAYPVFPNADAGADPSVPAEQGGRGFTGQGWETNTDFDLIGDPRAVKGGTFREFISDYPTTLRLRGPNTQEFGLMLNGLAYESLLTMHPTTLEYIPQLATHWQVSPDRLTYRFRLNPNARFSDGQPVTSADVIATWDLMMDKGLQDPSAQLVYGKFKRPVAESKYIVRVETPELNWRNFLYFSGMAIYPAHVLRTINGAAYIKEYNDKLLPGSGPYTVGPADQDKGNRIIIRRRPDHWAADARLNVGLNNFDEIHHIVVRDQKLAFEMFKRGDLDFYFVNISREWVEELNFDRVQRGMIQKRKVFNDYPLSLSGIAMNARRQPYTDIRVRQALTHMLNRDLLIERIFFNEYEPKNSFYFGAYENPDNPKNEYNPQRAVELLGQAGYTQRDAQGRLTRNGRPPAVELLYTQQTFEPVFTIYQEDLRKIGVTLNLRLVTFETMLRLVDERRYDLLHIGYTGLLFPNPETQFHSSLADVDNTNNITGFKSPRVDQLLQAYDREFDQAKREQIIREIDGIVAAEHHYILGWDAPFFRIAYWNKFGHPEGYLTRTGNYRDPLTLWWHDPQKDRQLAQARGNNSTNLPVGPSEIQYWPEFARKQGRAAAPAE